MQPFAAEAVYVNYLGSEGAIEAAVRAVLPVPLAVERFALSGPGALEGLLAQAGLVLIGGGTVACLSEYSDGETLWQAQAVAGPLQAALRVVGAQPLKAAVLRAVAARSTRPHPGPCE
jgi:hypothetical protein